MTLNPVHLIRVGPGLDAVRLTAEGPGLVIGSFGFLAFGARLDRVLYGRERVRVLYVGTRGVRLLSASLAPVSKALVPAAPAALAPAAPVLTTLPELAVRLQVKVPQPP